eukprot:14811645-Heterocapsa_arctica.AAC.1
MSCGRAPGWPGLPAASSRGPAQPGGRLRARAAPAQSPACLPAAFCARELPHLRIRDAIGASTACCQGGCATWPAWVTQHGECPYALVRSVRPA